MRGFIDPGDLLALPRTRQSTPRPMLRICDQSSRVDQNQFLDRRTHLAALRSWDGSEGTLPLHSRHRTLVCQAFSTPRYVQLPRPVQRSSAFQSANTPTMIPTMTALAAGLQSVLKRRIHDDSINHIPSRTLIHSSHRWDCASKAIDSTNTTTATIHAFQAWT